MALVAAKFLVQPVPTQKSNDKRVAVATTKVRVHYQAWAGRGTLQDVATKSFKPWFQGYKELALELEPVALYNLRTKDEKKDTTDTDNYYLGCREVCDALGLPRPERCQHPATERDDQACCICDEFDPLIPPSMCVMCSTLGCENYICDKCLDEAHPERREEARAKEELVEWLCTRCKAWRKHPQFSAFARAHHLSRHIDDDPMLGV